jgi:hypothetical protein
MSSTSNVQNLLTNVFRPVFVYDTTNGVYKTKLELTNVDTVSANTVYTFASAVGDASGNVYVGIGAGNAYSILATSANSNDTFVGTGAGGSTTSVINGVFIGYRSGFGTVSSSNSISIGANTLNGGNSNIYIGSSTGIASGSNNIFLGPGMSNGGTSVSNRLMIGSGSNTAIVGDLASNRVGINLSSLPSTTPDLKFDVNGFTRIGTNANGGLGINMLPGNYALDVTGTERIQDGVGTLIFSNGRLGVNNASAASYTLDVTGTQRTSNADGSMIFSGGNLAATNATGSLTLTGNKVGINTTATAYSLEIQGTQYINDGTNVLTFTGGIQTSGGGFRSLSGTFSPDSSPFSQTIAQWKRGNVLIAVRFSDNTLYVSSMYLCLNASTPTVQFMSGTSNTLTIQASGSDINISNSGAGGVGTYYYSITYFPMS